jgi:peptide/nickel transport system substrate-binding protein
VNSTYQKKILFLKKLKNKLAVLNFFKKKKKNQFIDKKLLYSLSSSNIPNKKQIKHLGRYLTKLEKIIILCFSVILIISLIYLVYNVYNRNFEAVAVSGGTYVEGVIGHPRLINPLYADNRDIDADLSYLIYSSLFSYDSQGVLTKDLVQSWSLSEDLLEYTIELKPDIKWHNGQQLKADDVLFTFYLMKNPSFRSNWQSSLVGVDLEKIDDLSFKFILQEPYAPFLDLLTFGIMPRFAWENASADSILLSDLNLRPIGSGPYQFESLTKNERGEIKEYRLSINPDYYSNEAYIENIVFKFYYNDNDLIDALNNQQVDGVAYLPLHLKDQLLSKQKLVLNYLDLAQIKAIYFNQKNELVKEKNIAEALAISLNRDQLLSQVLGRHSDGPLPISNFAYKKELPVLEYNVAKAVQLLAESGWRRVEYNLLNNDSLARETIDQAISNNNFSNNKYWFLSENEEEILTLNLSVPQLEENIRLSGLIVEQWEEMGIRVQVEYLSLAQMQNKIVKDKNFQALLHTQIIGSDPDISSFWHSSQVNGGLNYIAYNNSEVDTLLIEARKSSDNKEERIEKYHKIQELIVNDRPAIFLFSPQYLYVFDQKVKGFSGGAIIEPKHRFASIANWYIKTKKILTR